MHETSLYSQALYNEMLETGYVKEQYHPTAALTIKNYTEKAQYDQVWNAVTTTCRGLIVDQKGNIVARPLPKFFNYDHKETPTLNMTAPAVVMDKADGSLGIVYRLPDGSRAVATRGSFTSEQALHATELLNSKYGEWVKKASSRLDEFTMLVEIIYPENRIVLDYGDMDDLVLLGMIDTLSGQAWPAGVAKEFLDWPGPVVEEFDYPTFGDAMKAEPRENAEGFVVFFPEENMFVKIKQEDYLMLHRIFTNTSSVTVWELMAVESCKDIVKSIHHWGTYLGMNVNHAEKILEQSKTLDDLIKDTPDEFYDWIKQVREQIDQKVESCLRGWNDRAEEYKNSGLSRMELFVKVKQENPQDFGIIMLCLDDRDITLHAWKRARPETESAFKELSEDY